MTQLRHLRVNQTWARASHELYLGSRAPEVEAVGWSRTYDLSILAGMDIPWAQDGDRNVEAVRQWTQRRLETELVRRPEPVVELRGPLEARLAAAIDAIDAHLGLRPPEPAAERQQVVTP